MTHTETSQNTYECPVCQGGGEIQDPRDFRDPRDPDVRMISCPGCLGAEVLTMAECRREARRAGDRCAWWSPATAKPAARARIDSSSSSPW